jgi:hypothetical protein
MQQDMSFFARLASVATWRLVAGTAIASAGVWCVSRLKQAGLAPGLFLFVAGVWISGL